MSLKTKSTLGDGNCFYRSVSYALYGEQTFHEELRQDTIAYMANNFEKFQVYHGEYMSDMPILVPYTILVGYYWLLKTSQIYLNIYIRNLANFEPQAN